MRFGLWVNIQYPPGAESAVQEIERRLRLVREARELGFDAFWSGQHFLTDPYQMLQPVPWLARVAAEAPGATIGTMVMLLPLYQPVLAAEELATLDIISGGNLICGFALGYREIENEALGSPSNERVSRFREALQILEKMWAGEPFSFEGAHFRVPSCMPTLLPVQRPRPQIWLAANSDGAVRRAARLGDAWAIAPHSTLTVVRRQLGVYREARAKAGLEPPTRIPIRREVIVAPTDSEAWEQAETYLAPKYNTYRRWGQHRVLPDDDEWVEDFGSLAQDRFIVGSPDSVVRELERYESELGVTDLMMTSDRAGMPFALAERSLRLFATEVLPALDRS
jgi:alkanesulfonate monooxygenase SsuD/methylene tetrahydromethanopterin reductase-like flavin-dependent oxidoreductase (luciferase family)